LDKEIIRRIIRRHIEQVLACYEPERRKKADLSGRINVQFTIAASGDVTASRLVSSTMRNAVVEACTVAAVKGWEFPKPLGGGHVDVTYPFVFTPAHPSAVPRTMHVTRDGRANRQGSSLSRGMFFTADPP